MLVICLLIWVISGGFAELFWEMRLEQARITRDYGLISSDQERTPRERLQSLVFTIGAVLIVLTALSRMDIRAILTAQPGNHITALPWLAGGGLSTLLYFMLGFALLSLTKFLNLHTRWRLQGIPVSQKMAGRWALYSLIFLTFLAVMVSLLPTHFSMGLISFLHEPLAMILSFIAFIASALLALLLVPFLFLASLLGGVASDNLPKPEPAGGAPAVSDPLFTLSLPGWELIKPYLFWGLFLIVVIYAMRYYLLQHEELLHRLQNSPVSRWLQQLKQWISHLFRSVNHQIAACTVAGIERLRSVGVIPQISSGRDFLSLGRLSSRQQVRFYYYALIRRGRGRQFAPQGV